MEQYQLKLYMKSGNVITLDGIERWKVHSVQVGSGVRTLEIQYLDEYKGVRIVITSINLDQIEAITAHLWTPPDTKRPDTKRINTEN